MNDGNIENFIALYLVILSIKKSLNRLCRNSTFLSILKIFSLRHILICHFGWLFRFLLSKHYCRFKVLENYVFTLVFFSFKNAFYILLLFFYSLSLREIFLIFSWSFRWNIESSLFALLWFITDIFILNADCFSLKFAFFPFFSLFKLCLASFRFHFVILYIDKDFYNEIYRCHDYKKG